MISYIETKLNYTKKMSELISIFYVIFAKYNISGM